MEYMSPKLKVVLVVAVAILAFIGGTATAQRCGIQASQTQHNGAAMECPNNLCCGAGGFCGIGDTYCGKGCQSGNCEIPCGKDADDTIRKCPNNYCCSWDGYCGLGSKYCSIPFLYLLGLKCGGCQSKHGRCWGDESCDSTGNCPDNQCCGNGVCGTGPKYCDGDACTSGPCTNELNKACGDGTGAGTKCTSNYCCGTPKDGNTTHICGVGRDYCCKDCVSGVCGNADKSTYGGNLNVGCGEP